MEYKIGDMIYLKREPHLGMNYPAPLQECADNRIPVEIAGKWFWDCTYNVKIHWLCYWIFSDEIDIEIWIKCLFI